MGILTELISTFTAKPRSSEPEVIYLSGDGSYKMDITGEAEYQAALEALCGPRLPEGINQVETASLLVTDNKTGPNKDAVRVEIRGSLVGYLNPEDAIHFRGYLNTKGKPNAHGQCRAVIKGGWVYPDGSQGPYYVALDILALAS